MSSTTSRVFMNGNSQAVRIPREMRLNVSRVEISRNADGDLIIHPISEARGTALQDALSAFDQDYADRLEEDRRDQDTDQQREPL